MRIAYPCAALTTMLLCGFWHGAGFTFIVWGGLHGIFLSVERLVVYHNRAIPMRKRIRGFRGLVRFLVGWASTQVLVGFAWLFFRAESLRQVWYFLGKFLHWQGSELTGRFIAIVFTFWVMIMILDIAEYISRSELYLLKFPPAVTAAVCSAVVIVVFLYLATNKPMPFLYFQF
jgi:alginate O-acetyltransferase complex protein AlgI